MTGFTRAGQRHAAGRMWPAGHSLPMSGVECVEEGAQYTALRCSGVGGKCG